MVPKIRDTTLHSKVTVGVCVCVFVAFDNVIVFIREWGGPVEYREIVCVLFLRCCANETGNTELISYNSGYG